MTDLNFILARVLAWQVSVFEEDDEAYEIWRDVVGVKESHIQRMGAADNFWASGATGPCGPCSELYYDFQPDQPAEGASLEDDDRFIEFYNLVFMEKNRDADGKLTPLANKNIDTGLGLERMAQILQKAPNNYETDLIFPIIAQAAAMAGVDYAQSPAKVQTNLKVMGDHTRAVVYLISDGVNPSNIGRGYIVRRLLRRVVRCGRLLGIKTTEPFTPKLAQVAIDLSGALLRFVSPNHSDAVSIFLRTNPKTVSGSLLPRTTDVAVRNPSEEDFARGSEPTLLGFSQATATPRWRRTQRAF